MDMKLNAAQLEAFSTLAQKLHFTRAAEALHITQSALSQRIAKLEEELGTTLLIRDPSSLRLTEAGQKVLRFCQVSGQAEDDLLAALQDSASGFAGQLRVGGFSSVNRSLVIPALKNLMTANPKLSLHLISRELEELPPLLKRGEVDYILTTRKSPSAEVESQFLGFEDNVLVKAKKSRGTDIYLDHDENDPTTSAYFSQNKVPFKPKAMRYLDEVYGLIDGVKNGLGMAVLPLHLIESEKDLEILNPGRRLAVPVFLSFYHQPFYKKVHAVFLGELMTHFRERLRQTK